MDLNLLKKNCQNKSQSLTISDKVVPDWICLVMSHFTKLFFCERTNIAHIQYGDTLISNSNVFSFVGRCLTGPAQSALIFNISVRRKTLEVLMR